MIAPARLAAFEAVAAVAAQRADLPAALATAREGLDDERDRALVAEIATGVERWRAALDHLIATVAGRPIDRLDPEVLAILRLSAYQLLHLTRVPAAAVVDDAVDLARHAKKRSASGFVNAVLRALARRRRAPPLPSKPADPADRAAAVEYFATTLSHPRWLVSRWLDRLGFDRTERWLRFNNHHAPLTLRVNRLKLTRDVLAERLAHDGIRTSPGRYAPDALVVERGHPLRGNGLPAGWFVVQDEASQLVSLMAGPAPGRLVLDACAAPGGKTTALAGAMNDAGLLVACDLREGRIDLLKRTVARSGARSVRIVQADVARPLPFSSGFDCVLLDAPCSGLGTLRRDPDIKWRRRAEDLAPLAAAQRRMLHAAAERVSSGGRLIYATCSSEPEENDGVVDAFLGAAAEFRRLDARTVAGIPAAVVDERGYLRTTPHEHGLEAFFGAVFRRV